MKHRVLLLFLSLLLLLSSCTPPQSTDTTETDVEETAAETAAETETDAVTAAETEPDEPVYNEQGEKSMKQMEKYLADPSSFPFSFKYEGEKTTGFGTGFEKLSAEKSDAGDGEAYSVKFLHNASGATFELRAKAYYKYDALEWTVYITAGDTKTGVISEINAADAVFEGGSPRLKGISGDLGNMYAPYSVDLTKKTVKKSSTSGRPTHGEFPYYNLEYGDGGVFIAVGWPGCWRASFNGKDGERTYFTAGQNEFSAYLEPGETVRTPLIATLHYDGRNEDDNMNLWRRWFIECNMKKDTKGEVIQPVVCWGSVVQGMATYQLKRTINSYNVHGVPLDYLWIDAGWYVNADGKKCGWPETGMWRVNTDMFPDKFAEISKIMHDNGGKTIMWFEPEVVRCDKEKFLKANEDFKPEWFLGTAAGGSWLEGQLVDLGDPGLRAWLFGRITTVMDEGGIDMYRQDFNVDPAPVWAKCDGDNRQGVTENKYVAGYLALWDSLLEKYPDMTIDSCASGGGRNDLETMRRAVPLHISDFWDGRSDGYNERQALTLSLSRWFPYFKLQTADIEAQTEYKIRSCMAPWINLNVPTMKKSTPWDKVVKCSGEWRQLSSLFYSDFYPLTKYSKADNVFRAWEYFDSENDSGAILVFRAENCKKKEVLLKPRVNAGSYYKITDCDGLIDITVSGAELAENGLTVKLAEPASSSLIFITGVKK